MLTINLDIQDCLINGQVWEVFHIYIIQNCVQKVYIKFSDLPPGLKATTTNHLSRNNSWVEIEKRETYSPIKKDSIPASIKWTHFPLAVAWTATVHKVRGLRLDQGVLDFDLKKQKPIELDQINTGTSTVKTNDSFLHRTI